MYLSDFSCKSFPAWQGKTAAKTGKCSMLSPTKADMHSYSWSLTWLGGHRPGSLSALAFGFLPVDGSVLGSPGLHPLDGQPVRHQAHLYRHLWQSRLNDLQNRQLISDRHDVRYMPLFESSLCCLLMLFGVIGHLLLKLISGTCRKASRQITIVAPPFEFVAYTVTQSLRKQQPCAAGSVACQHTILAGLTCCAGTSKSLT